MLEGKVAIVTGAGRGLGRAHALELARQGARVVVNDYGVGWDGKGSDDAPAREVVREIEAAGGEAVAHYADVGDFEDAAAIVERAVATYGDLHVVVNNAGFVRDRMIFNMTEQEWDEVVRVHLKGHFSVCRHATAYWRERSKAVGGPVHARIVNTASEAYLFGSPGQPNYAAAKAGIVALTLAVAQSCDRYGVTANAICPRARTSMTEATFAEAMAPPADGFDAFHPENVSPLVAVLASDAGAGINGQVFVVHGGMVQVWSGPSPAHTVTCGSRWEPKVLADALSEIYGAREPGSGYAVPAT